MKGGMPKIISKEVFEEAQQMMNKRKKSPGSHKATTQYLLTGIIKCGECGYAMQGNKRKDKYNNDYISYRCGCRKQKRDCTNREIKRDLLEDFILKELEDKVLSDDKIPLIAKELNNKLQKNKVENEELLQNISLKLDKINKEIENILNAIMSGIINDTLKNKLNELESIKVNLELEIKELERSSENDNKINITEEQIKLMFSKFREFVLERNIPECKKFISQYVKEVIVYRDHVEVLFNVVFLLPESEMYYKYCVKILRHHLLKLDI